MPPGAITTLYVDFRAGLSSLDTDIQAISRTLSKTGRDFEKLGKSLTISLTAPIVAAGREIFKATDSYQKATRTIQVQTGATGTALQGLKKDFEAVASSVPNAFADSAKAISQVYARTGQTGEAAQELAKNFLELSNITETDLNTNLRAGLQLFDTWGVAAQDQIKVLNEFQRAAQASGGSVSELISAVGDSDKVFQPLGYSLEETIALFASFERGGVDVGTAVASLTKGLRLFAEKGVADPRKAMTELLEAIEKTPYSAKVGETAFKVLGKSGLELVDAAQEGRFHTEQFFDTIVNGKGTIMDTAKETRTFGEAMAISFNKANLEIAKAVGPEAFKSLGEGIKLLGDAFASAVVIFSKMPPFLQAITVASFGLVAAIGPLTYYFATLATAGSVALSYLAKGFLALRPAIAVASTELVVYNAAFAEAQVATHAALAAQGAGWAALGSVITGVAATAGVAIAGLFGGALLAGGDFNLFLKGFIEFLGGVFAATWREVCDFCATTWQEFCTAFSELSDLINVSFVLVLQSLGLGPKTIRLVCDTMRDIWNGFIDSFLKGVERIQSGMENVGRGFRLVIGKLGEFSGAQSWVEWAKQSQALADAQKRGNDEYEKTKKHFDEINAAAAEADATIKKIKPPGTPPPPALPDYLTDTKKAAEEAEKAIAGLAKKLADSKANAEIDKLKQSIDDLVGGVGDVKGLGSGANISEQLAQIGEKIRDKMYADEKENLAKLSGEKLEAAKRTIDEAAAYELQRYEQDLAPKMAAVDRQNHQNTVSFYQGLMEDVITGQRFDWESTWKKAAAAIAAEFLANMVEANLLASKSFSELFDGVIAAFTKGFDSWFNKSGLGDVFGSSGGGAASGASGSVWDSLASAFGFGGSGSGATSSGIPAGAIGQNADGSFIYGAEGAASTGSGVFGNLGAGFSNSTASTGQMIAGYGAAAYGLYQNSQNFGKDATGTGQAVGSAFGTAVGAYFGGPFGAAIGSQLGAIAGKFAGGFFDEKLTPNEKAIKKLEGIIEDTLKESLGKTVNFVVGNIEQFAGPNWAEEFWTDFGDKGADQFNALGAVFEKMFDLEKGVGGQIGALLAQNLAGNDLFESLDNIKLFMDGMGISIEQLTQGLLDTAKAGNISWLEFESMRQSLEKIPSEGLAAFGNISGAMDQVLESGGRGIQAIEGLKNIAIEAGEAGVTSFDALKQYLLDAGYGADTVTALFQSFAQRGIESLEELKNSADPVLGGVIADMETLGVKWEDFAESTDKLADGVGALAEAIRGLSQELKQIPDHINTTISTTTEDGTTTAAKKGAILKFAMGGVVNRPTMFPTANGMGLMGEAGAEAIMPLARTRRGDLGVSVAGMGGGGNTYNVFVDARGAKAGVEHDVIAAMEEFKNQAVMEAISTMAEAGRRG